MKITDTIIDLNLNMMINNVISKGAIYDHIVDIAFDLYQIITNTQNISEEKTEQLTNICMKTYENKVDEYVDFINEGLTDEIKKDVEMLDSFMAEKAYALIPKIEIYLLKKYNIFSDSS